MTNYLIPSPSLRPNTFFICGFMSLLCVHKSCTQTFKASMWGEEETEEQTWMKGQPEGMRQQRKKTKEEKMDTISHLWGHDWGIQSVRSGQMKEDEHSNSYHYFSQPSAGNFAELSICFMVHNRPAVPNTQQIFHCFLTMNPGNSHT